LGVTIPIKITEVSVWRKACRPPFNGQIGRAGCLGEHPLVGAPSLEATTENKNPKPTKNKKKKKKKKNIKKKHSSDLNQKTKPQK